MNHQEVWQIEGYQSKKEINWLKWCSIAEKRLSHSLDGDQEINGYSLDDANDRFNEGMSAGSYALLIRERSNYNPHQN